MNNILASISSVCLGMIVGSYASDALNGGIIVYALIGVPIMFLTQRPLVSFFDSCEEQYVKTMVKFRNKKK